jgi:hypothetical protein
MDRTDILLAVQRYMPARSVGALEHFKKANPSFEGAQWADVLDILLENDAHVDLTDAIYDDLRVVVPIGTEGWILPVFLTLLYNNKGHAPYAAEVAYYHGFVSGNWQRDRENELKRKITT